MARAPRGWRKGPCERAHVLPGFGAPVPLTEPPPEGRLGEEPEAPLRRETRVDKAPVLPGRPTLSPLHDPALAPLRRAQQEQEDPPSRGGSWTGSGVAEQSREEVNSAPRRLTDGPSDAGLRVIPRQRARVCEGQKATR